MDPDATQVLTWTGEFASPEAPLPQWEADVRGQLHAALERFTGPLQDLIDRDANEGDTRLLVTDFFSDGLGYNKYDEVTTEYRTKNESVDYGLKVGDDVFALVEVKRCGQDLNARSLRPARLSAAEEGVQWLVLTNGRNWEVYYAETAEDSPMRIDPRGGPARRRRPQGQSGRAVPHQPRRSGERTAGHAAQMAEGAAGCAARRGAAEPDRARSDPR